ncbi:MAG: SsrA-binding protein SmpB [Candidatus Aminicenantes bacterium]|nr:SsrA-binding protein SmpB [Candidatus Aminicenantes bacterium]
MKIVATNRKAKRDYEILETYEAGIELKGTEVKSIRNGRININDSFIREKRGELYLVGAHISPYEQGNIFNHDPLRDRKLLLHKKEIHRIITKMKEKRLTVVPLKVYFNKRGKFKVEIAVAKGRKAYEKKQKIKERDIEREMQAELKKWKY